MLIVNAWLPRRSKTLNKVRNWMLNKVRSRMLSKVPDDLFLSSWQRRLRVEFPPKDERVEAERSECHPYP